MRIKEYIVVMEELGGKVLRIKGQFTVPAKTKLKNIVVGRALNDAKAGDIVSIRV